jgi:hypothetical protein
MSQGLRVFIRSKATCAAPLCEVLTPCRGLRPHHVQKDRIGSWEISGLTGTAIAVAGPHREGEERAARLAAILVGESPYQHRSPVDAVVISNNEKGD